MAFLTIENKNPRNIEASNKSDMGTALAILTMVEHVLLETQIFVRCLKIPFTEMAVT